MVTVHTIENQVFQCMYLLSTPYPYVSKFCKFNFYFNYHCVVKSSVCTVTIGWSFVSLRLSFNDLMIVSDGSHKRLYDWSGVLDSSLCYCFLPTYFLCNFIIIITLYLFLWNILLSFDRESESNKKGVENWLLQYTLFGLGCIFCNTFWTNYDLDLFSTSKSKKI